MNRSGVTDLIEKPVQCRRGPAAVRWSQAAWMSLYVFVWEGAALAMKPSQKNCLTDNHR